MIYVYLFIAFLTAGIGAYTDIRSGHVNNMHLLFGIVLWIIAVIIDKLFLKTAVILPSLFITNICLALVASFLLYITDIWAPGDCKLFLVLSLIYPLTRYATKDGNIFPSLDIVIYAFALGYLWLIASHFFSKSSKASSSIFHLTLPDVKSYIISMAFFASISVLLDQYLHDFYLANQMLFILITFIVISVLQNKAPVLLTIFGIAGLFFFVYQTIINQSWLYSLLSLIASFVLVTLLNTVNDKARKNTYREITGDDVKPGMILSYGTIWNMQNCIDPNLPVTTTENRRSRINVTQANAVKTWCKNAKCNITIVETIPFAPFIAASLVIQFIRFVLIVG